MLVATFLAASFSLFLTDAVDAAINNRVFIGADGAWAYDQLQYLAWATDAARHGLVANLYTLPASAHVFLHPVWLVTGLLHVDAGLSYPLLLALWKLIAIAILLAALRAYAQSLLGSDRRAVTVAMVIALFMVTPAYLLVNRQIAGGQARPMSLLLLETFPVFWMFGYFPIALAVSAMTAFLSMAGRLVSNEAGQVLSGRRRTTVLACTAGAAASWLHPWQGMTLIFIMVGLSVWEHSAWRRHLRLIVPVLATAAPIVYYAVLSRVDKGWAQSESATAAIGSLGVPILATLTPLVLIAIPGFLRPARTPAERMLKLWPLAIVVTYIVSPSDPHHALGGLSIPLALLTVRGFPVIRERLPDWPQRRLKRVAIAGVCVAVLAAPAALARRVTAYRTTSQAGAEIPRDDARALDVVDAAGGGGGVLTTASLGSWVPAVTGHPTWVGHPVWTPDYGARAHQTSQLFSDAVGVGARAQRLLAVATGVRFVLEPCGSRARLGPVLASAGFAVERVGCATLYRRG